MKGSKKLILVLNSLLADELTVVNQYMVHSEMCENWGYNKLHTAIRKQAMDEMHHAEWLIERIIFFEGAPTVSKLNPIKIGKTVSEMISYDHDDELKEKELDNEYATYINEWIEEGKIVYVYFNNTMGDAFKNLKTLNSLLQDKISVT